MFERMVFICQVQFWKLVESILGFIEAFLEVHHLSNEFYVCLFFINLSDICMFIVPTQGERIN